MPNENGRPMLSLTQHRTSRSIWDTSHLLILRAQQLIYHTYLRPFASTSLLQDILGSSITLILNVFHPAATITFLHIFRCCAVSLTANVGNRHALKISLKSLPWFNRILMSTFFWAYSPASLPIVSQPESQTQKAQRFKMYLSRAIS